MLRDDFLLKQIEQVARFLARVLGLRRQGKFDQALDVLSRAAGELLGPETDLIERLDPVSAARMLGNSERVQAYARLLEARAEVLTDLGEHSRAEGPRQRAAAVRRVLESDGIGGT